MDDYVESGMVVGLGTGSTAAFAGMDCVMVGCRSLRVFACVSVSIRS